MTKVKELRERLCNKIVNSDSFAGFLAPGVLECINSLIDRKMHPERERMKHTKRRTLGFIPLNSWFPDADAHHLDHDRVAYIPHMIHKSVSHNVWTGRGMEKINALVLQYLDGAQP